jgi:hypothetical protein
MRVVRQVCWHDTWVGLLTPLYVFFSVVEPLKEHSDAQLLQKFISHPRRALDHVSRKLGPLLLLPLTLVPVSSGNEQHLSWYVLANVGIIQHSSRCLKFGNIQCLVLCASTSVLTYLHTDFDFSPDSWLLQASADC